MAGVGAATVAEGEMNVGAKRALDQRDRDALEMRHVHARRWLDGSFSALAVGA